MSHNTNHGREFETFDQAMAAAVLDASVLFVLKRLRGTGWVPVSRMVQR